MTKSARYDFTSMRVLVVDDSQNMLQILVALLSAVGIKNVTAVSCPSKLLDGLKRSNAQLLICDHLMQPQTGLEVIREIRQDAESSFRFIPIILLTGLAKPHIVRQARWEAGADAVLVKPVSAKRLFECIVHIYTSERNFIETHTYFGPDRRTSDRFFEGEDKRANGNNQVASTDDMVVEI